MPDKESHKILQTVRDFLKQEEDTYGPFQLPDIGKPESSGQTKTNIGKLEGSGHAEPADAGLDNVKRVEQAKTLEELRELCLNASELHTDLENTNLVFGIGNPDAKVMLIGEAPGSQEDKQGEPFVGRAGQLLNKILEAISFRREEVYIANILKHRPPNNRDPLPEERRRSLPYLYRQIDLIRPQFIVCLGRVSAQTLLDTNQPMKALRGRFHPFRNDIDLMVTFHPAALLRNPAWKRDTWEDVKMLRKRYDEKNGENR